MSDQKQHDPENVNPPSADPTADIEHAEVADDPRVWSRTRKLLVVATVSAASMTGGLGFNIYNPSISQIEEQLHASSGAIALSLSLFILLLGSSPLLWSALSEFWGRKKVYLLSMALCTVGCIVVALSKTIGVLIGMRCIQAVGSGAVFALGAATLADIYDPVDRGTVMGIYYGAPLIGPSLGPILGGVLTQSFNWRAPFWLLAILVGISFLLFIPFEDTFRRERSLAYQTALLRHRAHMSAAAASAKGSEASTPSQVTAVSHIVPPEPAKVSGGEGAIEKLAGDIDVEKQRNHTGVCVETAPMDDVKLSFADVNPGKPILHVLRRMNNLAILLVSGLLFGYSYSLSYTCSRTLANNYGYNALQIGLVLLSAGVGSLVGSLAGGRYSDYVFRKLKARNNGKSQPEMRLESTMIFMPLLPISIIAYGWVCEKHANVAAICVMLFLSGMFLISIYTCTLAYIVDANTGCSSSAVAVNSLFRGLAAFIAAEVASPLQEALGDGGLYSLWAGIMVVADILLLLVWWKGSMWREKWEQKERR